MKKNLFLRLFLMMVVVLSFHSCRQDILQEPETYHNTSAFQLTSKRISLDEAKHKTKLLPELGKAEAEFKAKTKNSAFGKTVNYGNGVSIDTDDVIYIENGPNYHTYSFRINRENAPADAPLENLLLVPLPDGKYKEYLVVYNLSIAEKEKISAGLPVDTKGKTEITELANGTYNGSGQLARMVCTTTTNSYWAPCSGPDHHDGSNYQDCPIYNGTQKGTPPIFYTIITTTCLEQNDDIITPIDPGGGGGYGGIYTPPGGNNPPCTGTTIPTNPQPGFTDENGCPIGAPTLPNLPNLGDDPCIKTKRSITAANNVLKNTTVQSQMDAVLKGKTPNIHEFALKIGDSGNSNYTFSNLVEGNESTTDMDLAILPAGSKYIGDGHSHAKGRGKPSAGDFYGMLNESLINDNFKYRYVYGDSDVGTDEIYALIINDRALALQFLSAYPESENYDINTHDFLIGSKLGDIVYEVKTLYDETTTLNTSGEDYHSKAVAMAYILDKFNIGISIAKVDNNGNLKKINAVLEEITNPDGTKGKRLKVSKCP